MNIRVQLQALLQYYTTNRQIGHTTAMLRGANNTKCIVLVNNESGYDRLEYMQRKRKRGKKYRALALSGIQNGALCGQREPIVFDNDALYTLFDQANRRILELERKLEQVKMVVTD